MKRTIAITCLCMLAAACVARTTESGPEAEDAPRADALLTLSAEGERLRLDHAPADPDYAPAYPNPEEADWMTVRVGPTGEMSVVCEAVGTTFDCGSNPFHTLVQALPDGGRLVEVRDMYGRRVAELITEGARMPERESGDDDPRAGTEDPEGGEPDGRSLDPSYSGDVGVVVDSFEGSFGDAPFALEPGTPVTAGQSSAGDREYLRLEIGETPDETEERAEESGEVDGTPGGAQRAYLSASWDLGGLQEAHLHVSASGRGYDAHTGRWLRGAVTHIQREEAPDGATQRVRLDAAWPDGSWARVVFRYNSAGEDPPATMATLPDSPPPSWNEFSEGCTRPALKAQFCEGVNRELAAGSVAYRLDCAALPDHPADRAPRFSGDRTSEPPFSGCAEVLSPPLREIGTVDASDVCTGALANSWEDYGRYELMSNGMCTGSPIILDLDGDGIALSGLEDGVPFDLFGSGDAVQTAWTAGDDDAFLVLDGDGDGHVAGAEELFGHATGGGDHPDGFEPLAALDDDGDGLLDARDAGWAKLAVWIDANRDGVSDPGEVRSIDEVGVVSLSVRPRRVDGDAALDAHGNRLPLTAAFTLAGGQEREMVDAFLRYRPLASEPMAARGVEDATPERSASADLLCSAR